MKKQIGIWLDLRNAFLIEINPEGGAPAVRNLKSEIEESQGGGGFRGKTPWSPSGGDTSRAAQERLHHEEKAYFERIAALIPADTDELLIFGPSEAKHGLFNLLGKKKHGKLNVVGVESADQMSEGQMATWAREYFHVSAPRRLPIS